MQLKNLKTNYLGRNTIYYEKIDSTQDEIFRLIKNKSIKNGLIIRADIQTKGKGTHGRVWHTDEENNIAFSFYIEVNCNINKLEGITIEIAEIILEIFKFKYKINLQIKTPNDILLNNKKIGGILTETKTISTKVKYLVVGIGINTTKENFDDELKNIATSIQKECGIKIDIEEFISEFCNKFEEKLIKRSEC